jgi:hypothetical protein
MEVVLIPAAVQSDLPHGLRVVRLRSQKRSLSQGRCHAGRHDSVAEAGAAWVACATEATEQGQKSDQTSTWSTECQKLRARQRTNGRCGRHQLIELL